MSRKSDQRVDGEGYPVSGKLHKCFTCGKEEPWGPKWSWYGSYRDIDDGIPIEKFCSELCQETARLQAEIKQNAMKQELLKARLAKLASERPTP